LKEYILSILPAVIDEGSGSTAPYTKRLTIPCNSSCCVQVGKRRGKREWYWENTKRRNCPLRN